MRLLPRAFLLAAVSTLAILLLCPALHANTALTITSNPYGVYGPYTATIGSTPDLAVFCEDGSIIGANSSGTLVRFKDYASTWTTENQKTEEEAILVASWALSVPNKTATLMVPYQLAIWSIMNTLGDYLNAYNTTPLASTLKQNAINAVTDTTPGKGQDLYGLNSAFMSSVQLFIPASWAYNSDGSVRTIGTEQRFIVMTPEPGTMIFMGTGVLLLALSRIRRKR